MSSAAGQWIGIVVSSSHSVTPSSSQGGFLTLSLLPCEVTPTEDSPSWTSTPWVLPTGCSSAQTAPVWIHSMGCSPSGTQRSSAGPCRVTNPASKPAQVWAPLSTHVHRSCQEPALVQTYHTVTASFRHSLALHHHISPEHILIIKL